MNEGTSRMTRPTRVGGGQRLRLSHTDPEVVMKRTKDGGADLAKVGLGYRETRLRHHALGLAFT
jgi:hypothetical protein